MGGEEGTVHSLDHDFHALGKVTPCGILVQEVPPQVKGAWYQGQLYITNRESVFTQSNPFLHILQTIEVYNHEKSNAAVMTVKTDGWADHCMEHIRVIIALLCIVLELDLDFLAAGRPAAGDSRYNEIERTFSIINAALQHLSLARDSLPDEIEKLVKNIGGMKDLRDLDKMSPGANVKEEWAKATRGVVDILNNRMERAMWAQKHVKTIDGGSEEQGEELYLKYRDVLGLGSVSYTNLTKDKTHKCKDFRVSDSVHTRTVCL